MAVSNIVTLFQTRGNQILLRILGILTYLTMVVLLLLRREVKKERSEPLNNKNITNFYY